MTKGTLPECLTASLKADEGATIQMATKLIVDEMTALHGGIWRADINHELGFVLVVTHGLPSGKQGGTA